jgi:PAS domain S-box-containing protein
MSPSQPGSSAPAPPDLATITRRLAEAEAAQLRATAALHETETAYRRLFDLNPLPLWVRAEDSLRFLAVNRAAVATYGYSREEFLSMTTADIRSPEERRRYEEFLARRRANGDDPEGDARCGRWLHRRKDGSELTIEAWSHALVFEGCPSRLVIVRDITEQLRTEAEARLNQERFQLVAAATSDAVWDWDFATDQLWWSESFYSLFGHSPAEFDHGFGTWESAIHPEDRNRVVGSLHATRDQGREFWREQYRFRRADGSYATVIDRGRIVRDPDGKPRRMVGGMSDITEQSRLQAQLLRSQRLESIGTLAGGIAHDLNNMLAPILLALDLLRLHQPSPDARRLINTIETSAQRGADLVRQVLAFSRGVEGRRQPLQIRHLIKEAARFANETFPHNLKINTDIPPDLWSVSADPTQLNQVLLNLSLNARDAMPDGGELNLAATNIQIDDALAATLAEARPGPHVVITVADTGHGIAPEHLDRIFEPFFTTKEVGKGTGLGLSTVHAIVREHHGFITVDSQPGRGSVFRVHLPAENLGAHAPSPATPRSTSRGDGQTILVIDDEPAIRELSRNLLESHGDTVITACDGAEGVALFAQNRDRVALVITDMVMPIMDGQATIIALHRLSPELPIIAASGLDPTGRFAQGTSAHAKHFLSKPYTPEKLLAAVADSLRPTR